MTPFGLTQRKSLPALFLVLWVLALLSVIVGEFCHTMRTEVNITRNFKEETQAYYIAVAGLNTAICELIKTKMTPRKVKSPDDGEEEEDRIQWRINTDIPDIPFAEGRFKVEIGNESGKININKAGQSLLLMMLNRFDLEENDRNIIAHSILDWRDPDHLHRLNGAEDDYYLDLPEPYECKDRDFDSVEELLLVRGITPEIYRKLRDVLTVFQNEKPAKNKIKNSKKKDFDYNKININAASPQMLASFPEMTDDLVQEIVEYRKEKDFESLGELIPIVGPEVFKAIFKHLSVETLNFYTIRSTGMTENSHVKQCIQVLAEIDTKLEKKYRVVQWTENSW